MLGKLGIHELNNCTQSTNGSRGYRRKSGVHGGNKVITFIITSNSSFIYFVEVKAKLSQIIFILIRYRPRIT